MRRLLFLFLLLIDAYCYSQDYTFSKDIAPIIYDNCLSCHRENGYAPFSLESYEDVSKRGEFVKYVTETKYMPPWHADSDYRKYLEERKLSTIEIEKIKAWVENGMPKGRKKDLPEKPLFASGSQIQGSEPDLTLKMSSPYLIKGNNEEQYICYKIPYEIERDTFVDIIEFVPGNKQIVHHSSYQILGVDDDVNPFESPEFYVYQDSDRVNDEHEFSYFKLISEDGSYPIETYHGGWLPGVSPKRYPEGMGFILPKKGVIMIRTLHYSPSPIDVSDQSSFNLFFSKNPINRTIQFAAFKPRNIKAGMFIPKDSIFTHKFFVRVNSDFSMLNINPHMHKLGKSFKSYAIIPKGDTIPLVNIPDWDFNWQDFYTFESIQYIPKGSVIHAESVYDNTSNNPDNPFFPPRDIYFESGSMEDTEEMMRLSFSFLPYKKGDEKISLKVISPD